MRWVSLGLCAAALAAAGCRTSESKATLREAGTSAAAAPKAPEPVFVVTGGFGTCKPMAFNGGYKSPFDGRVWSGSAYYKDLFAGTGSVEHGNSMVSSFLANTFQLNTYKNIWLGKGDWEQNVIFACHSPDTAFDKQEFVWWNPSLAKSAAQIRATTTNDERYAAMGFDWFYLKTPTPGTYADPYARDGYRGGSQGLPRFVAAIKKLAADLNPGGGLRPVYLLGHSMGGYMSVRLADQLENDVNLAGLLTIDPISPGLCPANKLDVWTNALDVMVSGIVFTAVTKLPGCTMGYPSDLNGISPHVRRILDDNSEKLGFGRDRKSWFHYYQDQFVVLHSGHNPWANISVLKRYELVRVRSRAMLLFGGLVANIMSGNVQAGRALNGHVAVNLDEEVWKWDAGAGRSDSWMAYRHRADALNTVHPSGSWQLWQNASFRRPSEQVEGFGLGLTDDQPSPAAQPVDADKAPVPPETGTALKCADSSSFQTQLVAMVGPEAAQRDFGDLTAAPQKLCLDGDSVEDKAAHAAVLEGADGKVFAVHSTVFDPEKAAESLPADAEARKTSGL